MGVIPPASGFLDALREITSQAGALLIFDEVVSGFRYGPNGAQGAFKIVPDLTCLGKIVGGGLPLAAYGGRREIMEQLAPLGPAYQAGTLSGNPIATAAGLATLRVLTESNPYADLDRMMASLTDGLTDLAQAAGVPLQVSRVGSMMTPFFSEVRPTDYQSAMVADRSRYAAFFRAMLAGGVYLPPSQFEAAFVSTAHTSSEIERTLDVARTALTA
jgi:glutamate-1-semialdehyde 2,1-aminomutase